MVYFIVKNLIRFPQRKRIKPRCLIVLRPRFTQVYPIVVQQVRLDLENEEIQVTQWLLFFIAVSQWLLFEEYLHRLNVFLRCRLCGRIGKLIFGRFTTNLTSKQLLSVFISVSVCLSVSLSVGLFVCFNLTNANSNQKEMELLPVNVPSAASNRRS